MREGKSIIQAHCTTHWQWNKKRQSLLRQSSKQDGACNDGWFMVIQRIIHDDPLLETKLLG